jgi:trehalose 6-phosphate synthase
MFRSLERDELLAYYRLADVGVVTPLNDGMNLVAKEYCACNLEEHGVLVLSEFAGAAAELGRGALLVNPYDIVGMANAMHEALTMPAEERESRMARLRRHIRHNDIHRWVRLFLQAAQVNVTDLDSGGSGIAEREGEAAQRSKAGSPFFDTDSDDDPDARAAAVTSRGGP